MANPHDDLAWASILRSPWSWFDTNLLYETALQEPESWMDKILLTAQLHPGMENLTKAIENASRRVGRDSLGTTVRSFWEDLDGPRKNGIQVRHGRGRELHAVSRNTGKRSPGHASENPPICEGHDRLLL